MEKIGYSVFKKPVGKVLVTRTLVSENCKRVLEVLKTAERPLNISEVGKESIL